MTTMKLVNRAVGKDVAGYIICPVCDGTYYMLGGEHGISYSCKACHSVSFLKLVDCGETVGLNWMEEVHVPSGVKRILKGIGKITETGNYERMGSYMESLAVRSEG